MIVFESNHILEATGEPQYPGSVEIWLDEIHEAEIAEQPWVLGRESSQPFCLRPNCVDAECNRRHE